VPPHPPAPDRYQRAADPAPDARAAAAEELAMDPSPQAAQLLVTLHTRDIDPTVRARAATAIELRGDPTLDPVLQRSAAADPDPGVRASARASHERLWPLGKRPGTAAGLSLIPGVGQLFYLDEPEGALMLSAIPLAVGGLYLLSGEQIGLDEPATSRKAPLGLQMVFAAQNLWFYSIFDAYRDARVLRRDGGYRFAITRESLGELVTAPFNPHVLKSPWVWGAVPLTVLAGVLVTSLAASDDGVDRPPITDVDRVNVLGHEFHRGTGFAAGSGYYAALFAGVGVGEESLFRGLVQTELEERFGTIGGLIGGSAVFGAVHILNFTQSPKDALIAVPVITVLGSGLGLAYIRTGHRLETGVAMHFWYDFLLSAAAFAADPTHQPFVVQYGAPM
jgi:membrane protease YdiL (CAAX protease family)